MTLKQARSLAAQVVGLENELRDYYSACETVRRRAVTLGAHSMARLCRWLATPEVFDRNGCDTIHSYAKKRANQWLNAKERAAMREWGQR